MKKKLVVIDACIRGEESRTRRIAEPIIRELAKRYDITRYDLARMPMEPLTPEELEEKIESATRFGLRLAETF